MSAPVKLTAYRKRVYRNFATLYPSQNLTDDLAASKRDQAALGALFYDTPAGRYAAPAERVLNKSLRSIVQREIQSKFRPELWAATRFSDGSWPVLYAAESEQTALNETAYHLRRFYREELEKREITVDRRVVALQASSKKMADLTLAKGLDQGSLSSADESGYPYCRRLARALREQGAEMLRTPSARHAGGICTPIFSMGAVREDEGHLKYLKLVLSREGCHVLASSGMIAFKG